MAQDGKVEVRKDQLELMQAKGELANAAKKAREIHERGRMPQVVRVRRSFVRLEVFGGLVEDERKPLPKSKRPLSAQMISPKGLTLKLFLLMLFAAQCEAATGREWPKPYPIEPNSEETDSWLGLAATVAKYTGPGVQASSVRTNKIRQIAEAMKTLERMGLLTSASGIVSEVRRGVLLLCENGKSNNAGATNIPYTVPNDTEQYLEIPVGFFTNGWVHVLTTSEIAALLMWFDIMKFDATHLAVEGGGTLTYGYVLSNTRHGFYGLGRDAYETHQPLEAFQLLDVHRPPKRHDDGKWKKYNGTDLVCHRIVLQLDAFDRDAGQVVLPVLKRRHTINEWRRPLQ